MVKDLILNDANVYHTNKDGDNFYDLAIQRTLARWIEKNYPEVSTAKKYNL